MKKTTNTANFPHPEWVMGGNPNAIEMQESEGQKELVSSMQLPRKCNHPHGINATEQYNKMGIKVFTSSKGDDLFMGVKLPDGWKKESTDHAMWNNLIDDKGRIRATFFYKGAFYDREAFINFRHRYSVSQEYVETTEKNSFPKFYCVKDNATDEIIFKTEISYEYYDDNIRQQCVDYLKTNYPEYENLNSYWD